MAVVLTLALAEALTLAPALLLALALKEEKRGAVGKMTMLKPATPSWYELGPSRHSNSKFNINKRHGNENEMTMIPKLEADVKLSSQSAK